MDKETTKKVAAMIATLVDKKVEDFQKEIVSLQKSVDKRIVMIEKVVEKLASQKPMKSPTPSEPSDFKMDDKQMTRIANRVFDRTSDKISGIEGEFEGVKKDIYELLGETRVKLDETAQFLEVLRGKSSEIDDFLRKFSKQASENFESAKKLGKELSAVERGMETKLKRLESEVSSLNRNFVDKKELSSAVDKFESSMKDALQKNAIIFESTKRDILKTNGKLEADFEQAKKQFAERAELNALAEKMRKIRDIVKAKDEMLKLNNKLEKRVMLYDSSMKSAVDSLNNWKNLVEEISKRLSSVEASVSGLDYLGSKFSTLENSTSSNISSLQGKMKILEQYFRNPEAWIGEKISMLLSGSLEQVNKGIASTNQSITLQKKEFLFLLANLSLTKLSTSEQYSEIFSESRVLEYIINLMKSSGSADKETMDYVKDTLISARDFWESRNSETAALIEGILDRIRAA